LSIAQTRFRSITETNSPKPLHDNLQNNEQNQKQKTNNWTFGILKAQQLWHHLPHG
jgi:hypothetical protein